ncbi:MAG: DUF305 domain-containing protein [Scytonematopsis contorta HA4267-MV1]|nr:DUF305 domain-containing protein [Scytonematopsis contorta HA4267-MV1]
MISMDTAMSNVSMTDNPDVDFADMMIAHHQGAIDMAKIELLYGSDSRLRRNLAGAAIVTTLGPIKQIIAGNSDTQRRYLAIVPIEDGKPGTPVQIQFRQES